MKKVVRIMGLCTLMALAFTACQKNDDNVVIKASMPKTASDSRTHYVLDSKEVVWDEGDQITVFDVEAEGRNFIQPVLKSGTNTVTGTFIGTTEFFSHINDAGTYTAFYPVSRIKKEGDQNVVYMKIPASQPFVANSFAPNIYPMCATNEGDIFEFSSPAGMLTIGMRATEGTVSFKNLTLTVGSGSNSLVGTLKYGQNAPIVPANETPSYEILDSHGTVALTGCDANGPLTSEVTYFNFVLLEGSLEGDFLVSLRDENNGLIAAFRGQIEGGEGIKAQTRTVMPTITFPLPDKQ